MGQLLLVPIALAAIPAVGWRTAMAGAAALLAVVVAPVLWRYLRDRPEDVGQLPIGGPLAARAAVDGSRAAASVRACAELLRSRAFWGLGLPFFVCGITTTGLVDTHLIPLAQDRGISGATTGLAVALLAAANVTGILASGPLADRVDNRLLLFGLYATRGLSLVALLAFADAPGADPVRAPLRARRLLDGRADPVARRALRLAARRSALAFGCLNAHPPARLSARRVAARRCVTTRRAPTTARSSSPPPMLGVAALTCLTLPRPQPLGAGAGLIAAGPNERRPAGAGRRKGAAFEVPPPGIEPGTFGLRVRCSAS